MDANKDGILTHAELVAEVEKTLQGYDANKDDIIQAKEYQGRGGSRSAMGGFVKQHSKELDKNGDGDISKEELFATPLRMFAKADANEDKKVIPEEFAAMSPPNKKQGDRERPNPPQRPKAR